MEELRKPFYLVALLLLLVALVIESGADLLFFSSGSIPGLGISTLALLDALLSYLIIMMGLALLIPQRLHSRIQAITTLVASLLALAWAAALLLKAVASLSLMLSLFLAIPLGTATYFTSYAGFDRDTAAAVLGLLMLLKLGFAVFLILAHQRYLQIRSLIMLIFTSLAATLLVEFLHALPPGFLVSITDGIGALVVALLGLVWSVAFLLMSLPALVKSARQAPAGRRRSFPE